MKRIDELNVYINNQAKRIVNIDRDIKYLNQKIASLECDKTREIMAYENLLEEYECLLEVENQIKGDVE